MITPDDHSNTGANVSTDIRGGLLYNDLTLFQQSLCDKRIKGKIFVAKKGIPKIGRMSRYKFSLQLYVVNK